MKPGLMERAIAVLLSEDDSVNCEAIDSQCWVSMSGSLLVRDPPLRREADRGTHLLTGAGSIRLADQARRQPAHHLP